MAILDHLGEGNGPLMQLVAARLDAADVEDLVDQVEQVLAALMNVVRVFLVGGVGVRTQDLGAHDL